MLQSKNLSIKQWSEEDRPREKLLQKGIFSLTDAELIAVIIGSGTRNETAVELGKKLLLQAHNDLNELSKFTVKELTKEVKGIGDAKAISIVAALELGRRRKNTSPSVQSSIQSSQQVAEFFYPILSDLSHEEFWILLLNRGNKVVSKMKVSSGGISQTVVDCRIIFKYAIQYAASALVLCHNHPSGTNAPSKEDKMITDKIREGAKLFDIAVLDHIIISGESYFSFADQNLL